MPFYIRKHVSLGPLRFNLFKSGVGVSAGIPGMRVGTGPRGNYIHMGRGGLYYRKSLPSWPGTRHPPSSLPPHASLPVHRHPGASPPRTANILQMVPDSARDFLREVNRRRNSIAGATILVGLPLIGGIVVAGLPVTIPLVGLAVACGAGLYADKQRKSTVVLYEFDEHTRKRYEDVTNKFDVMKGASSVWHVEAVAAEPFWKTWRAKTAGDGTDWWTGSGGITKQVVRSDVTLDYGLPEHFVCNIDVPRIKTPSCELYFFPDRLLVVSKAEIGAVEYRKLEVRGNVTHFFEDAEVPADAPAG